MQHKILIIDDVDPVLEKKFSEAGIECDCEPDYTEEDTLRVIDNYSGLIIRSKILIQKEFIDNAPNLKCIGRVGAGMETIDVEYAESKGVRCFNSPEGNRDAVGEQAIGMLLILMNNLIKADREVRSKTWDREGNRGIEIKGRTVGIIGYGNMGGAFARKLSGFECRVIAYDKYKTEYGDEYAEECSLEYLKEHADIISLHVPQTDETIGMFDKTFVDECSKSFILINTARGKVVDTNAVMYGIESGKMFGAALDVLEYESFNFQDFLSENMPEAFEYIIKSDRVVLTPHIAGWTVESKTKLSAFLAEKMSRYLLNL